MKTLVIIRHAKSSWEFDLPDFRRPLTQKGIDAAHLVSKKLKLIDLKPSIILSSPATRAYETAKIITNNAGWNNNQIKTIPNLYDFEGQNVLQILKNIDDQHDTAVIFGHNYALTYLINKIGSSYIDNLPTCGVAVISFDIFNWNSIQKGTTQIIITPKSLRN